MILDACRDNPFGDGSRDTGKGWAKTDAPNGSLIVYATSPGKTASDGEGKNGLFTSALLKRMKISSEDEVEAMFIKVRNDVSEASKGRQMTWTNSSVRGEYSLSGQTVKSAKTNNKPANAKAEQQAWEIVQNESNPSIFREFLREYPSGANAPKARERLEDLVWAVTKINYAKLQAFLDEFPQGKYAAEARDMQAESAWEAVKNSKDKAKYEAFLKEYPEVKFAFEAKKEISRLDAVDGNAEDRKNSFGMNFTYIKPGQFLMGAGNAEMEDARLVKRTASHKGRNAAAYGKYTEWLLAEHNRGDPRAVGICNGK